MVSRQIFIIYKSNFLYFKTNTLTSHLLWRQNSSRQYSLVLRNKVGQTNVCRLESSSFTSHSFFFSRVRIIARPYSTLIFNLFWTYHIWSALSWVDLSCPGPCTLSFRKMFVNLPLLLFHLGLVSGYKLKTTIIFFLFLQQKSGKTSHLFVVLKV